MRVANKEVGHGCALLHRRHLLSDPVLTMGSSAWVSALASVFTERALMATRCRPHGGLTPNLLWHRGRLWVPRIHGRHT